MQLLQTFCFLVQLRAHLAHKEGPPVCRCVGIFMVRVCRIRVFVGGGVMCVQIHHGPCSTQPTRAKRMSDMCQQAEQQEKAFFKACMVKQNVFVRGVLTWPSERKHTNCEVARESVQQGKTLIISRHDDRSYTDLGIRLHITRYTLHGICTSVFSGVNVQSMNFILSGPTL